MCNDYSSEKRFGPFFYERYGSERTVGIRIPNIINLRIAVFPPSCSAALTLSTDLEKINVPVTTGYRLGIPWPVLRVALDLFVTEVTLTLGKN